MSDPNEPEHDLDAQGEAGELDAGREQLEEKIDALEKDVAGFKECCAIQDRLLEQAAKRADKEHANLRKASGCPDNRELLQWLRDLAELRTMSRRETVRMKTHGLDSMHPEPLGVMALRNIAMSEIGSILSPAAALSAATYIDELCGSMRWRPATEEPTWDVDDEAFLLTRKTGMVTVEAQPWGRVEWARLRFLFAQWMQVQNPRRAAEEIA